MWTWNINNQKQYDIFSIINRIWTNIKSILALSHFLSHSVMLTQTRSGGRDTEARKQTAASWLCSTGLMSLPSSYRPPCKAICIYLRGVHECAQVESYRHQAQREDTLCSNSHNGQNDGSYRPFLWCQAGSRSIVCDFLILFLTAITSPLQISVWWPTGGICLSILASIQMHQFPLSRAKKEHGYRDYWQAVWSIPTCFKKPSSCSSKLTTALFQILFAQHTQDVQQPETQQPV